MKSNLQKYKKDLEKLVEQGNLLHQSLLKKWCESFDINTGDIIDNLIESEHLKSQFENKKLPDFHMEYQFWYSESLVVIQQLIPLRENDFKKLYEGDKTNKKYRIENYLMIRKGSIDLLEPVIAKIQQQVAILRSAQQRFESSLFDIRQLLQADLFDSELSGAKELNTKGFVRGAGVIAGVVLENHLKQVCENHKIKISSKNPTINNLNNLLKDKEIIDISQFRKIQFLGDLRNLCSHDNKNHPIKKEIANLIKEVEEVIKIIF